MYVLHHADKPELYRNLPERPASAHGQPVEGLLKPIATPHAAACSGFFHYITVGPGQPTKDEPRGAAKP